MKNRSYLREVIMKVLYQVYILDNTSITYDINDLIKEQMEIENEFVQSTILGIILNQNKINELANKYLVDWDINSLSKVDKAILSIGIYELTYTETPKVVAINEAIDLSKRFSDTKITSMINAVLDGIYHNEE
ncbi:MAG: transcription antitermination factor NusB [Bacilli bacterium]